MNLMMYLLMHSSVILNFVGLCLNAYGSWLIYKNSFVMESPAYLGSEDFLNELNKRNNMRDKKLKKGASFLFLGFFLQIISLFFEAFICLILKLLAGKYFQ